jgi:FkbM family methyltransferase
MSLHIGAESAAFMPAAEYHVLALEVFADGRPEVAAKLLATAIETEPTAERLNDLGVMVAAFGDVLAAANLFRQALALDPLTPDAAENLADVEAVPEVVGREGAVVAKAIADVTGAPVTHVVGALYRPGPEQEVPIPALGGEPLHVRPGTSDVRVIDDTFHGLFHLAPDWLADVRTIADLGSNIGSTIAHYACLYPQARIAGAELDPENARLARQTIAPWSDRCTVEQGAIAAEDGTVRYKRGLGNEFGYAIGSEGDCEARAWSLDTFLDMSFGPDTVIDFLKVDIEGAEEDVFARGGRWPARVRVLKAEVHGWYTVEKATAALTALGFRVEPDTRHWSCVVAWRD